MSHAGRLPAFCIAGAVPDLASQSTHPLWRLAERRGWVVRHIQVCDETEMDERVALVVLREVPVDAARRQFPHALLVSEENLVDVDLCIPRDPPVAVCTHLLGHAERHWQGNLKVLELFREVGARRQRMNQLSEIGRSLSLQMDFADLLKTILLEARRLAGCEAGSLYLVDDSVDEPALVFKLAQNDAVDVPFVEQRLPLTTDSLAGYVAVTGEEVDIHDVYSLPDTAPYQFNRSFDDQMCYRTRSVFVLPMRDHRDKVVGVLQFINRLEPTIDDPVPFDEEVAELLRAVAGQAAVSIQKNQLIRDVHHLFESFVQASVKAIEQRDPATSGHSFRVAETTIALLQALPRSKVARFRALEFSEDQITEVRYAALLHDFGKVGVRENVLLKANKLTDERLEVLRYRLELQKERLRRQAVESELEMLHHGHADIEVARRRVHRQLESEISTLDEYFGLLLRANMPNIRDEGDFQHLREIRDYAFREFDGSVDGLITELDMGALSIRRGSLTPEERIEIESHVNHTREFLAVLPWPPELAAVPAIAAAHHEKIDGSGYPDGLAGEQIPLPSRAMTVCDIYDALTSMDRPYKRSMTAEVALNILEDEARQGLLDTDMVRVFVESRVYTRSRNTRIARQAS